ncbi:hypothetical protein AAFN47_20115 [Hoeflea sp. CAU 1731]
METILSSQVVADTAICFQIGFDPGMASNAREALRQLLQQQATLLIDLPCYLKVTLPHLQERRRISDPDLVMWEVWQNGKLIPICDFVRASFSVQTQQ